MDTGNNARPANALLHALDSEIENYEAMRVWRRDPEKASREAMMTLLASPLHAMLAVWYYECEGKQLPNPTFARDFAFALHTSCSDSNHEQHAMLGGGPREAFPQFAATLGGLIKTWRERRPDSIGWLEQHPDDYRQMQRAQACCSISTILPDVNTGPSQHPLKIRMLHRQKTYQQAGKTAALVLWGDFLMGHHESVDFCDKCNKPFQARSNKQFCGKACATGKTSLDTHKNNLRLENEKRMRRAAEELEKWLRKPAGDWRKKIDLGKPGDRSTDKRSRWLSGFLSAALSPEAAEKQFDLCFDPRQDETAKKKARAAFYRFLKDIRKADSKMREREGKSAREVGNGGL